MYNPEQFPSLMYKIREPKTLLLLFNSGKLLCIGAKSEKMVYESVNRIYDVLEGYELFYE